ncbi:MAG: dTDP-4-dehydrorhamnose 3,5-epimerase family protein [Nitrospirae bacterium]|nr:dTDP-4-dehydrorhamnose 3,5-epimerase family protein [Nitrospirota bacterium]
MNESFKTGEIDGVIVRELKYFHDKRGWLTELFREDELPEGFNPQMAYVSMTQPSQVRGPHEHVEQTDYFCFLGDFVLYLWDNRPVSSTHGNRLTVRDARGKIIIVPPGVVHAYKNVSGEPGLVINLPDRLYAGWQRVKAVDEIRHEGIADSPYVVD